jgi:hypothetical protein
MSEETPPPPLPDAADVLVSTAASLVNLAAIRLTEAEHRNAPKAKEAIDAARALVPLCPEEAAGPIRDALSQVQMLYVRETGGQPKPAEPGAAEAAEAAEAEERAKARAKIWTPGSE